MATFKRVSRHSNKGKKSEDAVAKYLTDWHQHPQREFNRLVDSKAAGRIIKAAAADFEYYTGEVADVPRHGLIEVKETEHDFRLARAKVPQLARMRKRANCGGLCLVLVHHSVSRKWRAVNVEWLEANGDKGSWNLSGMPQFDKPGEALAYAALEVFS